MSPVAALDMGTNSTRLLVAEPDRSGGLVALDRQMIITRLGQGVDRSGKLADDAMGRTIDALRSYRSVMDRFGVPVGRGSVRATATSAARDAGNRAEFFASVEEAIGVEPELLSGDDEARLSFRGATEGLDPADGPFLVFDLGGGSTEFSTGTTEVEGAMSIDIGCVRLTEKFMEHDPPAPEELVAAISLTEAWLDDVVRTVPGVGEAKTVIGLAGTVSSAAAIEIGLPSYDRDRIHHFVLSREAVEDVFRTLATETRAQRLHNPGLEAARVDVIVGGLCALVAIMRFLSLDEILVSESDILDGLALSLL